jgi:hypothetical protein
LAFSATSWSLGWSRRIIRRTPATTLLNCPLTLLSSEFWSWYESAARAAAAQCGRSRSSDGAGRPAAIANILSAFPSCVLRAIRKRPRM